jgi:WD40 repeat protein
MNRRQLLCSALLGFVAVPRLLAVPAEAPEDKPAPKPMTMATSPDGRLIVTAQDEAVVVSDAQTQKTIWKALGHKGRVTSVAFAPDGKLIASGGEDKTIRLYDAATGKAVRIIAGKAGIAAIGFSQDGKAIMAHGADKSVQAWDLATGKELPQK